MKVENFRAHSKNSLFGFADVVLPSGLMIWGVGFHSKNGKRWVGMPAREYQKPDGMKSWSPMLKFSSREISDRFQREILDAFDKLQVADVKPQTPSPRPSGVPRAAIPPSDSEPW